MKKFFAVLIIFLTLANFPAEAIIKNGPIRGKSGLSFGGVSYGFDSLSVTIRNSTKYNLNFGGAMLFLDKNYRMIARAEILPAKVKRNSSRQYKAFFSFGTGEEAKSAKYLEWEF